VALSVTDTLVPCPGVTWRHVHWSPDFPRISITWIQTRDRPTNALSKYNQNDDSGNFSPFYAAECDVNLTGPHMLPRGLVAHPNCEDHMPPESKRPPRTPVSTILTPLERSRVDAAAQGLCDALHRESLEEVLSDLREQKAGLVLISVTRYGSQSSARVAAMVREFPRIPAVALLTETQSSTPHATLSLGQLGIRTLIDARQPAGWQMLRNLLASQGSTDLQRSALTQISLDLPGVSKDCWRFFELLFDTSPRISTVRQLSRQLNILPSTLMSRFFRAKLPAPKRYLSLARLIRAARLFENPGLSVARVANHLDYSSPQSFGRHVRTMMKMSPVKFRSTFDGQGMLQFFRTELVLPYADVLCSFRPSAAYPGWIPKTHRPRGDNPSL
jgi:AraC-like DNA-binding protein